MSSIQERLQMKRVPIDKWSIREQLCLASAVVRSGDQNWSSVSRALKPFAEPNRPPDWFSQKNCAAQYGSLLEQCETPKRKKRLSGQLESIVETPGEIILKKLTQERKQELQKIIEEEKKQYFKLQEKMNSIKSGTASDSDVANMCLEIEREIKQKEQDAIAHAEWLKSREEKKLEVERAFRPLGKVPQLIITPKRKISESIESIIGVESPVEDNIPTSEPQKPALSPLLTSLLKTPSSLPNVSSSILHSAITSHRVTSPTIASLLNSSTSVPVSPSLQQLVTSAISQEPANINISITPPKLSSNPEEVIEDTTLPIDSIYKVEKEIEEIVAEIKKDFDVQGDLKIEDVIEPKFDILKGDPVECKVEETEEIVKQEDKDDEEKCEETEVKEEKQDSPKESIPEHDVYDFDESSSKTDEDTAKETATETSLDSEPEVKDQIEEELKKEEIIEVLKTEVPKYQPKRVKEDFQPGVEIVEVVVMEDDEEEMNKKVSEIKCDLARDKSKERDIIHSIEEQIYTPKEKKIEAEERKEDMEDGEFVDIKIEPEEKSNIDIEPSEHSCKSAMTPEYTEAFFDMAIEVTKLDKSGKAKRDYSRTKKKEEKDIDILLAVEKAVNASMEENDATEETGSEIDSQDSDKKSDTSKKMKDTLDRSNSPWTEEEDITFIRARRRYSTPATPIDSVPNSPASSIAAYDDDRDYRAWKKSVMLVYSRLSTHKYASLFLKPITEEQAPGYHSMVYRPMDLQTIRKNVESGHIRTTSEFYRDVLLMFNNAIMYNKSNDHVYNMARQMQQDAVQEIQILFQAQAAVETPARRETRTSESGYKRKRAQDDLMRNKKRRDD